MVYELGLTGGEGVDDEGVGEEAGRRGLLRRIRRGGRSTLGEGLTHGGQSPRDLAQDFAGVGVRVAHPVVDLGHYFAWVTAPNCAER